MNQKTMLVKFMLCGLSVAAAGLGANAATLKFEGAVGNSGTMDKPVVYNSPRTPGLGVVWDETRGVLAEGAGQGKLNFYTLDGREVASCKIPKRNPDPNDRMIRCGDNLILKFRDAVWKLPPAGGGPAVRLSLPPRTQFSAISSSSRNGEFVLMTRDGALLLVNPAADRYRPFGQFDGMRNNGMDWGPDGEFYIVDDKWAHRLQNGKSLKNYDWPKNFIGRREPGINRATRLGKYWFGFAGHGTVKRFDAAFEPAPGVVQGGGSGHFIGYVPGNYELDNGRGIVEIRPGLYAASGIDGVIQLLEWRPELRQLKLVRRIGAVPRVGTLALDRAGHVFLERHIWNWTDDALAPAAFSNAWNAPLPIAAAMTDPDSVLILGTRYGRTNLAAGKLLEQQLYGNYYEKMRLPKDVVATVFYSRNRKPVLLILGAGGNAIAHEVAPTDRRNCWRRELGEFTLETVSPVRQWSGAAMGNDTTLLAVGDGVLIEFAPSGPTGWKETRRWSEKFGLGTRIAVDGLRLAVSDPVANRVSVYDLASKKMIAATEVKGPGAVVLNGPFLLVSEPAAQRVLKFKLEE